MTQNGWIWVMAYQENKKVVAQLPGLINKQ